MTAVMNDDILGRLVAYEKYVNQCFAQVASRRWRTVNALAIQEYERMKAFKSYLSEIVDLAFDRYGLENGLTKAASNKQNLELLKDLESLIGQLNWSTNMKHVSSPKRQFALVS